MSTCYTRAANSRKVAYVSCRRRRWIVHVAAIESCLVGKRPSPETEWLGGSLARVVNVWLLGGRRSMQLLRGGSLRLLFDFSCARYATHRKKIKCNMNFLDDYCARALALDFDHFLVCHGKKLHVCESSKGSNGRDRPRSNYRADAK